MLFCLNSRDDVPLTIPWEQNTSMGVVYKRYIGGIRSRPLARQTVGGLRLPQAQALLVSEHPEGARGMSVDEKAPTHVVDAVVGVPEFLRGEALQLRDRADSLDQLADDIDNASVLHLN